MGMVQSGSRGPSRTLWSIQYLRALSAIAVVAFHQLSAVSAVFLVGAHGVDVFFVISGFIMVVMTENGQVEPASFSRSRLARIVPAYWLATMMAYILALEGTRTLYHPIDDPVLFFKSLMFIPAFNPYGEIQPTLYLGWTLQYEIFFYAVFAAILFARKGRLTILSVVLVGLVSSGAVLQPASAIGLTYTNPLLLEFLAGAWMGKLFGSDLERHRPHTQFVVSGLIATMLFAAALLSETLFFGGWAVLIIAVGLLFERRDRMPQITWLKRLGDASFAIYLFQEFAFLVVLSFGLLPFLPVHPHEAPVLTRSICIMAAIGLGIAMWRHFERPVMMALQAAFTRSEGEQAAQTKPVATADVQCRIIGKIGQAA